MSAVMMPDALSRHPLVRDERFFFITGLVMAGLVFLGFGLNLALGRSSFAAPPRLHLHAVLFFAWTVLYVVQIGLVARGSVALHRRLGWAAAVLMVAMVVSGITVTVLNVRDGRVPPFFDPAYFLVMNPLHILSIAGLVAAAVVLRRQTRWHRRLMYAGMALLLAPAFGRLLPMPLFVPHAGSVLIIPPLLMMAAGAIRDWRSEARVHPAWWWGMATAVGVVVLIQVVAYSPLGLSVYEAATAGAPAALAPLQLSGVP